jgi:hypothetical protein
MRFRSEEAKRNLPQDLNFAAMARAVGLLHLSLSSCITLAKQSQCFMCEHTNHVEGLFSCLCMKGNEGYRSALNAMYNHRKHLRDDMQKLGIDDALRRHNLQRLWTPPGGSVAALQLFHNHSSLIPTQVVPCPWTPDSARRRLDYPRHIPPYHVYSRIRRGRVEPLGLQTRVLLGSSRWRLPIQLISHSRAV